MEIWLKSISMSDTDPYLLVIRPIPKHAVSHTTTCWAHPNLLSTLLIQHSRSSFPVSASPRKGFPSHCHYHKLWITLGCIIEWQNMCRSSVWAAAAAPTAQPRPNSCFRSMLFLITVASASVFAQGARTCDITVFTKSWQCSCGGKAREVFRGCWWESGRRMWRKDQSFARPVHWTSAFPKILVGFYTILVVSLLLSAVLEWLWRSSYCCTLRSGAPPFFFFLVPIRMCHHILASLTALFRSSFLFMLFTLSSISQARLSPSIISNNTRFMP